MLRIMIFRDALRFLFLYTFVLLSFSFSVHALLNLTRDESVFRTIFSTFNLMLGITDTFSDEFMASLQKNLLFDFIYSAYIHIEYHHFIELAHCHDERLISGNSKCMSLCLGELILCVLDLILRNSSLILQNYRVEAK